MNEEANLADMHLRVTALCEARTFLQGSNVTLTEVLAAAQQFYVFMKGTA